MAWSGAAATAEAARAAVLEQARLESRTAAAQVSERLATAAHLVFGALVTAGPDALPVVWAARKDWPAGVEGVLLVDDAGRVLYPRPPPQPAAPWVDERAGDTEARDLLRAAQEAEFGRHDPAAAAESYARVLDERFGRTVRLEALVALAALEAHRGNAERAAALFAQVLDQARFPPKFVDGETRVHARLERVRALARPGRAAAAGADSAAAELETGLRQLLAAREELDAGAYAFFRGRALTLITELKDALAAAPPERARAIADLCAQLRAPAPWETTGRADLAEWLAPLVRGSGGMTDREPVRFFAGRSRGTPVLAAVRAYASAGRTWQVAFQWSEAAGREVAAMAAAAGPPGARATATALCDLAGRPLLAAPSGSGNAAPPSGPPAALTSVPQVTGWTVRADLRDPAGLERSLQLQRWGVAGAAVIFFAVTAAGLALLFRAARREMELARLKTDFVAHVSHELKTPLSLVRMFAETLALGRARDAAQQQEFLDVIVRESERLSALIDNLLDFARIEQGRRAYRCEPVDLGALLHEVADAERPRLERQGAAFTADLAPLPPVRGDRAALASAVSNLIENAIKYSLDEKSIALTACVRDGQVEIAVRDRGIGVPASERARIFEPFYRAADERVQARTGSGLGLALVRHCAAAHGGSVRVEPNGTQGTVFTLALPVAADV